MTETATITRQQLPHEVHAETLTWLEQEFPGWTVDVDVTAGWRGDARHLWIARQDGHHPQSELSAAKLHTRLTEYLEREGRRRAGG